MGKAPKLNEERKFIVNKNLFENTAIVKNNPLFLNKIDLNENSKVQEITERPKHNFVIPQTNADTSKVILFPEVKPPTSLSIQTLQPQDTKAEESKVLTSTLFLN